MSHLTTSCCYLPRATDKKVKNAGVRSGNEQSDQQIAVLAKYFRVSYSRNYLCVSRAAFDGKWDAAHTGGLRFRPRGNVLRMLFIVCATFYYEQLKTKERESGMSATTKMEIILTTNARK